MLTFLASAALFTFGGSGLPVSRAPLEVLPLFQAVPHTSIGPEIDFGPLTASFPGRKQIKCYSPGRLAVTRFGSEPDPGRGYFAMGSNRVDGEGYCREGELVYIDRWVGSKGYYRGELYSKFNGYVALVKVDDLVTKDVRLVDGEGTIHLALVDGAQIERWTVPPKWDAEGRRRAISLQFSRNIELRHITIGEATRYGPGEGYGIESKRTVNVNAAAIEGDGLRHVFTVFSGANIFAGSVKATNPKGTAVDTHGYGARWVSFCQVDTGGSNVSCGNRAKWGDQVDLWDIRGAMVWLHGPSEVRVYDSKFSGPAGFERNAFGEPKSFYAERSTFTAYSNWPAIHKASADLTIQPVLVDCLLKAFTGGT